MLNHINPGRQGSVQHGRLPHVGSHQQAVGVGRFYNCPDLLRA